MSYYLSEIYSQLPIEEKKRIQKRSGTILGSDHNPEKLRKIIIGSLRSGPSLKELFEYYDFKSLSNKIVSAAGVIQSDEIPADHFERLKLLPHFIFPAKGSCFLSAEAFELYLEGFDKNSNKTLFETLLKLSPRERNAFCRWLQISKNKNSGRYQSNKLYRKLLFSNRPDVNKIQISEHLYLDQIWPNDPNQTQLAWFYRDVLPFYQCLLEEEQRIMQCPGTQGRKLDIIHAFKFGQLVIEQMPPVYEHETRYKVHSVMECSNNREIGNNILLENDSVQNALFS